MTVRPWRKMVRNVTGDEFIRPPEHSYITMINGHSMSKAYHFMEVKTKSLTEIMEGLRASNEKAGRKLSYKISKDGMTATWTMRYTNVRRIVRGKTRRFIRGVENNE